MPNLPKSVRIIEVGPRDGLQIEPKILSVEEKLQMIEALTSSGLAEVEVGSYVNPKAVPQMASTEELVSRLPTLPGVIWRALWLNAKGLERAVAAGKVYVDGKLTLTCSETFVRRNTNRGIEQTLLEMPEWISRYTAAAITTDNLGLMAAFGCNFEGDIPASTVVGLLVRVEQILDEHGCRLEKLSLADTMGWANPLQIQRTIAAVQDRWPHLTLKLHLHDTRGLAMANAYAGLEMGVTVFDSCIGGLGGCPFAGNPKAAGNIATEDLVFMCQEMGIETGIDLDRLLEAGRLTEQLVGHPLTSKVLTGGTLARMRAG